VDRPPPHAGAERTRAAPDSAAPDPPAPTRDSLAYTIFTSGSTGTPKAVAIPHRPVIHLIDWLNRTYDINPSDTLLATVSIAFDLSVYDIFGTLAAGARLRFATKEENDDPQRLARIINDEKITIWNSTPAAFQRILAFLSSSNHLRLILLSGDWLPIPLAARIRALLPNARLIVLGGATEATIWSNYFEVDQVDPTWRSIPYGRPIPSARYYILDPRMRPCADGQPGDLYIAGECLSLGYLNDPELTARKFPNHPTIPAERLYNTGDRARLRPDGLIELLGRSDRQLKIHGYRIEPAEIERVLERHPQIHRAVVLPHGTQSARRLIAFAARGLAGQHPSSSTLTQSELKTFLSHHLPPYMIPSEIRLLGDLPTTLNGKIDIAQLDQRLTLPGTACLHSDPPRTPIEQQLADILSRLLQNPCIGRDDNFFELGASSLQAVELISAAAAAGLQLRLADVHTHPTIRELATAVRPIAPLPPASIGATDIPLTPTQHWFFDRNFRYPGRYNLLLKYRCRCPIDPLTLKKALEILAIHHPALRLRFKRTPTGWTQFLSTTSPPLHLSIEPLDCQLPSLRRDMHLEQSPLFQAILPLTPGQSAPVPPRILPIPQRLFLLFHHLIIDAFSLRILLEDLQTLLDQIEHNQPPTLPPATSFESHGPALLDHARFAHLTPAARDWLNLPWHKVQPLPKDVAHGPNTYGDSQSLTAELSRKETTFLVHTLPRTLSASIGEILLAELFQTLAEWTGHQTLLIDLTHHGRDGLPTGPNLSRTVGYLTTIIPILLTVPRRPCPQHLIRAIQDQLTRTATTGIDFGLLRYLSPDQSTREKMKALPRAQLKFNYLGSLLTPGQSVPAPPRIPGDHNPRFHPIPSTAPGVLDPHEQRAYPHNLELHIADGRLHIQWKFSTAQYHPARIQKLLNHYVRRLRDLLRASRAQPTKRTPEAAGGIK
jgi:amino acid adenylation domain-containing protein/non-ribosomal peptide synthase protein (TIGR01720 family)